MILWWLFPFVVHSSRGKSKNRRSDFHSAYPSFLCPSPGKGLAGVHESIIPLPQPNSRLHSPTKTNSSSQHSYPYISILPSEVLAQVFTYLSIRDLCRVSQVEALLCVVVCLCGSCPTVYVSFIYLASIFAHVHHHDCIKVIHYHNDDYNNV